MMEEVTIAVACDAKIVDQMSDEEIIACLVAEARPKTSVPSKKAKLRDSQLLLEEDNDHINRYQRENRLLQQTSLRLEQENDNLAHRLVTSKIALRKALDQTEDKVDDLTKDLLETRHRLQAVEEEKKGKQEEAAMLKEVFRRELEKTEQQLTRSSGIVADYKQICGQLTSRLERQNTAHKEELNALKTEVTSCPRCRRALEPLERSFPGGLAERALSEPGWDAAEGPGGQREKDGLSGQVGELRRELAQTKLQVVEASVKIQELEHQRGILLNDLQAAKNSWFSKTFTSLWTTSGGQHHIGPPRDGAHVAGWRHQGGPLSAWSTKRLPWPHSRGHV